MKIQWENMKEEIKNLQPNSMNTEIRKTLCENCKNSKDEEHVFVTIRRNNMKNCRCMHRFDLIICNCIKCNDDYHIDEDKVIKQLIEHIDFDKLTNQGDDEQ